MELCRNRIWNAFIMYFQIWHFTHFNSVPKDFLRIHLVVVIQKIGSSETISALVLCYKMCATIKILIEEDMHLIVVLSSLLIFLVHKLWNSVHLQFASLLL